MYAIRQNPCAGINSPGHVYSVGLPPIPQSKESSSETHQPVERGGGGGAVGGGEDVDGRRLKKRGKGRRGGEKNEG